MNELYREVRGYGDKYLVNCEGDVLRRCEDGPRLISFRTENGAVDQRGYTPVAQFDDPPRVTLYRNGKRWAPRVATLVERLFG